MLSFKMAHVILILGSLTLLCNGLHTVYEHVYYFYFETFFFNLYFLTLVFYASHRLILGMYPEQPKPLKILQGAYAFVILLYIGLLVAGILFKDRKCERKDFIDLEDWYVLTRAVGLALSLAFLVVGSLTYRK